jgi:histone H3/H4
MVRGFPIATVKRIMKKAGVSRASDNAAKTLADVLNELGFEISKKAVTLMYHSGRKTVTGDDIKLAASQ